jgi:hypothetical protein
MTWLARFFAALARWCDRPDAVTASGMIKRINALEEWQKYVSVQLVDMRVQIAKVKLAAGFETFTTVRPDEV